jgi:hypothetical protein
VRLIEVGNLLLRAVEEWTGIVMVQAIKINIYLE